jgi:hypothetical protein
MEPHYKDTLRLGYVIYYSREKFYDTGPLGHIHNNSFSS